MNDTATCGATWAGAAIAVLGFATDETWKFLAIIVVIYILRWASRFSLAWLLVGRYRSQRQDEPRARGSRRKGKR